MLFTSPTFLFLFLPVVWAGHTLLLWGGGRGRGSRFRRRAANGWLLVSSLLFYFWGEHQLLGVMLLSIAVDYLAGWWMKPPERKYRWLGLAGSLTANLALLGYFKYAAFGMNALNQLWLSLGGDSGPFPQLPAIVLPLGISFYTFQSMSYSIDVCRRAVAPTRNLLDFACYVSLFPQLVAGPIVRYRDVANALTHRRLRSDHMASGFSRLIFGLAKKLLLANPLGVTADTVFSLPPGQCGTWMVWGGALSYTLQIYFDFSGYSDMAIGLGRLLGFEFKENFRYPYAAQSMRDFWRRWHISLSEWFRDYLYIPLGGNRFGPWRTCLNLCTVFFLCGLWHGASLSFIVWGLYHGGFLAAERLFSRSGLRPPPRLLRHGYVLLTVLTGWIFFRADNLHDAWGYLGAMINWQSPSLAHAHPSSWLPWPSLAALLAAIPLCTPLTPRFFALFERRGPNGNCLSPLGALCLNLLLVLLMLLIYQRVLASSYNPFLYFRF